jgi:hypothetical protein
VKGTGRVKAIARARRQRHRDKPGVFNSPVVAQGMHNSPRLGRGCSVS